MKIIRTYTVFLLMALVVLSCKTTQSIEGNVYKLSPETNVTAQLQDELIKGLRIDAAHGDTLLVKYKFDEELFMDADFVYRPELKKYESVRPVVFGKGAGKTANILLLVEDKKHLYLQYSDFISGTRFLYQKTYKKKVHKATHRNAYYAEDGFPLQKNEK